MFQDPPIWLLDVDGPINATRPGWGGAPHATRVFADREYKLRWSPELLRRIRRAREAGAVELWWATTWCPWAALLEAAWKLPPLPRALTDKECAGTPSQVDAAKLAAARAVLALGRRLIWTDDTAVPRFGPLYDELTAGGRALLIAPSAKTGLQPDDMDRIEKFAGYPKAAAGLPAGGTSGGVEITDKLIDRLAAEAERGYDLPSVTPR